MPKSSAERYIEWLEREEEILGVDATTLASVDLEAARDLLYEELGYDPTEAQLAAFMTAGAMKYETLPQFGVETESYERPYGKQVVYRDVITGRFVSREDVVSIIGETF